MQVDASKNEFFECQCYSNEHVLKVTFLDDDKGPDLYACVYLNQYHCFFQRIWLALKYICGYHCKDGHFDCFIMKVEDVGRMKELLCKFEESWKQARDNNVK